jgi:hypothetical protein
MGWFATGSTLLVSILLARGCQLGLREGRIPPSGWWSLGAHRVAIGATALCVGRAGLVLAGLLALLGVATGILFEHLIDNVVSTQAAA